MGQSITQRDERWAAVRRFRMALADALAAAVPGAPEASTSAGLGGLADLVRSIDAASDPSGSACAPARLPVCRFCHDALAAASRPVTHPLVDALRALMPALAWTQNPNYRRQPPDASFLDNYGYAVIAGPADGPAALAVDARLAVGVLLLGPRTHYRLHAHPAVEVYYTLTPGGEWWRGAGPWRTEPPGAAIYHAPNVPHATRAGAGPLLAIYVWSGDLATHARLA